MKREGFTMKKRIVLAITLVVLGLILLTAAAIAQGNTAVSRGGLLYDKWWKVTGDEEPTTDQPLWATQTTNARSGDDSWRCKECHGWDYQGVDGAYGSGSHLTGFPGVLAAQGKTAEELATALQGGVNADHDFSSVLDEASINDLVTFLQEGAFDQSVYVDYDTKAAKNADVTQGDSRFAGLCASCHGADGTALNWGNAEEPEYVGTLANDNPWEFLHKARFGHPGTAMPSTVDIGWNVQDAADVLAYAQTLPTGAKVAEVLPETGGSPTWTPQILLVAGLLVLAMGLTLLASQAVRRVRS
jgi:mono/diheme cytochrome c family protein